MTRAPGVEEQGLAFLDAEIPNDIDDEPWLIDVDVMERMEKAGVFSGIEDNLIELKDGRLIKMAPPTADHGLAQTATLIGLHRLLEQLDDRERVAMLGATLVLDPLNGPIPDVMILKRERWGHYVNYDSAIVVVEVAYSSRRKDMEDKRRRYASVGIPEYWVTDVRLRELTIFSLPFEGDYADRRVARPGDRVSPLFAEGRADIAVADLFA